VPTQKSIRALELRKRVRFASSSCLAAGVPDRPRARTSALEPMTDPAASRREASFAAGEVAASGGAALVPMVEPAQDR
jgi:hypothetical protein